MANAVAQAKGVSVSTDLVDDIFDVDSIEFIGE